jgi:hypothetical protein
MIGIFLIVELAKQGDERSVASTPRPLERLLLGPTAPKKALILILNGVIDNNSPFELTRWTSFDVDVCHVFLAPRWCAKKGLSVRASELGRSRTLL